MRLAAQLYTLRNYTKTLDGFAETLKKVAQIGYKIVQVSGTCDYEADWLREQLQNNGLSCCLTHINPKKLQKQTAQVIREHEMFDCRYIGIGSLPDLWSRETDAAMEDFIRDYKPVAQRIAQNGYYLSYHNHDLEFEKAADGRIYLEHLEQAFRPAEMGFTIDTYWVQSGGGDAAYWIQRLSGRVPCVHLKDMVFSRRDGRLMTPVGSGNINFESILQACADAGTEYAIVEQDDCYGEDPFQCLKQSYQYLTAKGLK